MNVQVVSRLLYNYNIYLYLYLFNLIIKNYLLKIKI